MKIGSKDLLAADPVSIKDARDNQCTDWIGYYSGRKAEVSGKKKLDKLLVDPTSKDILTAEEGDIQPYYPGLCKPKECIGKHRQVKPVGKIVAPKSPSDSSSLVLRHETFKKSYPTLSRPR